MPLAAGMKLGPYEIVEPIGKGGMGEVYRARDTKLERDVAIKVLPDELAADGERVARFEREAKLLASLNHPNIAGIYGFESNALVLELVEGPTLADRIEQGPLPVDEVLAIAKQIADALEAGHEAGVIHRDLKPANIKVRDDGTVKVLDYGLAKALEGEEETVTGSELSQSPTLTRQGTQIGVILGTAAYMSPEQAKGKRVDKRTDIWAFGAVVYEMLTGKRAFAGGDVSDTLAAVLRAEPDLDALPSQTPGSMVRTVQLCLTKSARQRLHDIADVRLAMEGAFETSAAPPEAVSGRGWRAGIVVGVAAALLLSIATGLAVWSGMRPEPAPRPVARFSIPLPDHRIGVGLGWGRRAVVLSPDGSRFVYVVNNRLYVRAMDRVESAPIEGTEGARGPFFSPDGEWVGFWAEGRLKKVRIRGGAVVNLCEARNPWGATQWGADDTIVFATGLGIMRVSADGGEPELFISANEAAGTVAYGPQILPGQKAVLFTLLGGANRETQVVVESLESRERHVLVNGSKDALYLATGHVVYALDGTLFAVPFDVDALEVKGGPVPMVEDVVGGFDTSGAAQFSISDSGDLIYASGDEASGQVLVWVDRDGREEALSAVPRAYEYPRIAPDGSRAALFARDQDQDIWIWDFARETLTRLTFDPGLDAYPAWTPDGERVAFGSTRAGNANLYWKAADGTGTVERLTDSEHRQWPYAFTPDGTQLVFTETEQGNMADERLGVLSLGGSPEVLHDTEFRELNAELSPDGRWLAYQSNASGQDEIYVRPFPNVEEGQWSISNGGGEQPLWSPDGRELFYVAPGTRLMAVGVQTEPSFVAGKASLVIEGPYRGGPRGRTYDISPDGKRFLMVKDLGDGAERELILVQNWFSELERLVPIE